MLRVVAFLGAVIILTGSTMAGTGYEVTSSSGDLTVTYMVKFGGGRAFQQHTAYDPVSERFVYLTWPRGDAAPEPVAKIWDHESGRTIELFKFPGAEQPLPVIPSMDAMKVCPKTGDKDFTSKAVLAYD